MTATTTETTSLIALTLPGTPYSVRMARFYVRAALSYHDLGDYAQDAEAVVSELVTNAIEHAGAPCIGLELTLLEGSGALAVVVTDHSPHPPIMCEAQDGSERGYGLRMVAALSARWGWIPRDTGKVVYAILSRKRQPMEAISEPPMLNDIDAGLLALSASRGKGGSPPRERRPSAMTPIPSVRRMLVGSMLRCYREAAGYKLDDAAGILECDRSKISRVETGQRGIRPKELRELLTEYNVAAAAQDTLAALARPRDANAWWRDYRRALPDAYLDFAVAEGVASRILVYAPLRVPELLWTAAYGQAVAAADPTVPEDAEEAAVEAAVVYRGGTFFERQPDCTVILGEAALRRQTGSLDDTRAQLTRIAELSGPDYHWLTIRILPFSAGICPAGGEGEYSILQFSGLSDVGLVHVAGPQGGVCLSTPSSVDAYTTIFRRTTSFSLDPEQSAQRFRRAARC